jgi:hypothetical protein
MNHETSTHRAGEQWVTNRTTDDDGTAPADSPAVYRGSRFADVWRALAADAYDSLPEKRLGLQSLPALSRNIYHAAQRTLESPADLLPPFEKLVHPLGICLRGSWSIDVGTSYTGLFRSGSKGLLIARASDAMGETRPGKLRFMGLAGKLYPTTDPEHATPLRTANFFTLEGLAGTHSKHFVDAIFSTDLWPVRPQPGAPLKLPLAAVVGSAFMLADRAVRPRQAMIRQLYPIAELGEWERGDAVAPAVMRLVPSPRNRRVETSDLREELRTEHHPDGLRFEIEVADQRSYVVPRGFLRIGQIHFTESVASYSGDHRLHFAHPPYRHAPPEALPDAEDEL